MDFLVEMDDLFECVQLPLEFQMKGDVDFDVNKGKPSVSFTSQIFYCTIVEKDNFEQGIKQNNLLSEQFLGVWIKKSEIELSGFTIKEFDDARFEYYDEEYRIVGRKARNNLSNYVEFICGKGGG